MGRLLGPMLVLLVSVLCWPATAPADQPMTFQLVRTSPWGLDIYAAGEITHDTPGQFAAFLQANRIEPPATVFLFSGGGDLDAGLALGREIRQAGLDTEVGVPQGIIPGPAECDSSCTFVFLGGVTRTMAPGSRYGVHRFSGDVADPLQTAQEEAGKLVAYIAEMGVSRGMYSEMTEGTPAQVKYLDAATMAKLRITTTESVRGKMVFDAGYPVLMVQDLQGLVQYGRIDFFCRTGQLIARGYFSRPDGVVDAMSSALAWTLYMPGGAPAGHVAVPSSAMAFASTTGKQVAVDVYVPPSLLFDGILKAHSIWLRLDTPGDHSENDVIGLGMTEIPASVKEMLQTLARSC